MTGQELEEILTRIEARAHRVDLYLIILDGFVEERDALPAWRFRQQRQVARLIRYHLEAAQELLSQNTTELMILTDRISGTPLT